MAAGGDCEPWIIEPLARGHDRKSFDCGEPALDEFIKRHARQQQDKNVGRTFVAVEPPDKCVLGFYTLAAASIEFEHLPAEVNKRLPRYPVPAARIGRLAVDGTMQGKGLGSALLRDALLRVARIAQEPGSEALLRELRLRRAPRSPARPVHAHQDDLGCDRAIGRRRSSELRRRHRRWRKTARGSSTSTALGWAVPRRGLTPASSWRVHDPEGRSRLHPRLVLPLDRSSPCP